VPRALPCDRVCRPFLMPSPARGICMDLTHCPAVVCRVDRSVGCFGADHSMHDEAYDDATQKKITNRYSTDGLCLITRQQLTRSITISNDTEPYASVKHKIAGRSSIQMVRRRCLPRAPRRLTPILLAAETLAGRVPCAYQLLLPSD
jgi:hypothetical protein